MSVNLSSNTPQIHPSSVIDEGAIIGEGTKIWHFCHVSGKAILGSNCNLGQNVFIDNDVVVGNGVKIQNNVSLYQGVEVGDDCFIGPSAVFTNVINPRAAVERRTEFKSTKLERGVTIGANATIVCGITLGAYAFVGAGAVVTENVKPFAMVVGVPAVQRGWMSEYGEKLEFDSEGKAECRGSGSIYRLENGYVKKVNE